MTPLALYVHIPWCIKKCPYCDFNSHVHSDGEALPEQAYLQALLSDLDEDLTLLDSQRPLHSIFIGGGTPSLMSADFFAELLSAIKLRLVFSENIEITLEANPGTVDQANFKGFRQAGINRLSLGVQSFSDLALQQLGRIHSAADANRAFEKARAAGFNNINLDLMHGLPGQGVRDAEADLARAIGMQPEHISWYQLTIERNTAFYSNPPRLPDEPALLAIHHAGIAQLAAHQYLQYEVSAFARAGRASRHNLNYWQFGDYLGIGAGAHAKLSTGGEIVRRWKTRVPSAYLSGEQRIAGTQSIARQELPLEFMMNALRLREGFAEELFCQRTGLGLQHITAQVDGLIARDLLRREGGRLVASDHGWMFLNDVIAEFS